MFSNSFIEICSCSIRPALAALILYVIAMGLYLRFADCSFVFADNGRQIRNRTMLLYVCLAVLFLGLQFFNQRNETAEETILMKVLESYLKAEDFLAVLLILLTVLGITFAGNVYQYLGMILKFVRVFSVLFIFGNFLTGLCAYTVCNIILLCIMWVTIIATANCTIIGKNTHCTNGPSSYSPKDNYNDLSPSFKEIADRIVNTIVLDTSSTYSICLAGEWGIGKTSIIQGVEQRLKELSSQRVNENKGIGRGQPGTQYEVIRINALELDTADSLFQYLFSRIKQILKKRGMYVGVGSTYRKFIGSSIDTLTQSSLSILMEGELFARNEDYRAQKKELSDLIARAMHSGRIVVIVDDIERCEQGKIRDYLFFVKEIVSMERCIPVFVTDYDRLVKQIKENDEDPHIFLDKFFNYTIHVTSSAAEEVIAQMQVELDQVTAKATSPYLRQSNIKNTVKRFNAKLDSMVQDKRKKEQETASKENNGQSEQVKELTYEERTRDKFQNDINNTRTIVRVCRKMLQYYRIVINQYEGESNKSDISNEQLDSYVKQIHLDDILFLVAYVECCVPLEFVRLAKSCEEYVFNSGKTEENTEEYSKVIVLARDLLFKNGETVGRKEGDIHTDKAVEFISVLINQPERLLGIVDWYESKIKKAKALLRTRRFDEINLDWLEMMRSLLQEQYFDFGQIKDEDEEIISGLIEYLKFKLHNGQIESRDILEAMRQYQPKYFVSRVGLMSKIWNLIQEYPVKVPPRDDLYHNLCTFKVKYIWTWFTYYIRLVEFVSEDEVNWPDSMDHWTYRYYGENVDSEVFIEQAIDKIQKSSGLNCTENTGAIQRLGDLTKYLCERCEGAEKYPEILYNLSYIKCAKDEIKSWMEIENIIMKDAIQPQNGFSKIEEFISYFEKNDMNSYEMGASFDGFMKSLEGYELKDTVEDREKVKSIHKVLSKYLLQNEMNYTKYRRTLRDLEKKMK